MRANEVLDAAARHLEALYEHDARGRIVAAAPPSRVAAPRFHLVRTVLGNLWRFRADTPLPTLRRLASLAAKEPAWRLGDTAPPERGEFVRRALEETAPVEVTTAGPVFAFPRVLAPPPETTSLRALAPADAGSAHAELELDEAAFEPDVAGVGAFADGQLVAVCFCVRRRATGPTEARVLTAPAFRARGLGSAVVARWAQRVRERGGTPFFSAGWDDAPARALAARLRLELVGEDRAWR